MHRDIQQHKRVRKKYMQVNYLYTGIQIHFSLVAFLSGASGQPGAPGAAGGRRLPNPSQAPTLAAAPATVVAMADGATIVIPADCRIEKSPPVRAPQKMDCSHGASVPITIERPCQPVVSRRVVI
jgi:hypothetical protein